MASPDLEHSLLNVAEAPRVDDWSLRSALVRLAQPEPVRAGAVLEVIRRCEGGLQPFARALERHVVETQPSLSPSSLVPEDGSWRLAGDGPGQADIRLADLARLAGGDPGLLADLIEAYGHRVELDAEELAAAPLVLVAAELDQLAGTLTRWAEAHDQPPPVDEIDHLCDQLARQLDQLGVPREIRPEERSAGERRWSGRRSGERGPGGARPNPAET
jgi:hypothetical protein